MTKRWERELRGLNDVEVPTERIRGRSRRAPSGTGSDPMRSPRQRIVAGAVAFVVFAAAGTFAWRALRPNGPTLGQIATATSTPVSGQDAEIDFVGKNAPLATLMWNGAQQDAVRGEYSWCDGGDSCVTGIPEFTTYPPVDSYLPIPGGAALGFEGDVVSLNGSFLVGSDAVAKVSLDDPGSVPTTPGRYALVLNVHLSGPNGQTGSATFFLGIEATANPPSGSPSGNELAGTEWRLVSIGGTPMPAGAEPISVGFAEDRMSLMVGCRGFWGPYLVRDTSIKVGDLVGIMPLCPGEGKDDLERSHAAGVALAQATTFDVTGDRLTITGPTTALVFEATATLTAKDLVGSRWRLVSINGVAIPARTGITLKFQTAYWLDGSDGCNNYTARYRFEGSSIRLVGGGVTDILCSGDAEVRAQALADGLRNATSFQLAGDRMTIASPTTTLVFVPVYII